MVKKPKMKMRSHNQCISQLLRGLNIVKDGENFPEAESIVCLFGF